MGLWIGAVDSVWICSVIVDGCDGQYDRADERELSFHLWTNGISSAFEYLGQWLASRRTTQLETLISLPGPACQFHGQVKGEKTSQPPPQWARWGEAEIPLGRAGGGVHTHKLCFGFLLLTNAFSGGWLSQGGEPPKKGFKSSPL